MPHFSHGTHEEHGERIRIIREVSQEVDLPLAILQDLQGAKVRLGIFDKPSLLTKGEEVILFLEGTELPQGSIVLPVQYDIFATFEEEHRVYINDGLVLLSVKSISEKSAICEVLTTGPISTKKGLNLPDTYLANAAFTEKDRKDLMFGLSQDVDYVALSFVQKKEDLESVRTLLPRDNPPKLIVKFETRQAVTNIESVVEAADVVMVARGDLAIEAGQEQVPIIQEDLIRLCREHSKQVIVATQMLESMIHNSQPTRAEVSDVATAVMEKADAIMLSAESATGDHPRLVVETMSRIAKRVEEHQKEISEPEDFIHHMGHINVQTAAVAQAAVLIAHELHAAAIFCLTSSGTTAIELSEYRPTQELIVMSRDKRVCRQLLLVYGTYPLYVEGNTSNEEALRMGIIHAKQLGLLSEGDTIVYVEGSIQGRSGGTDTLKVVEIQ